MEVTYDLDDLGREKGIKLVHWNVRSILKKIDQIRTILVDSPIDIITVSETWLRRHLNTKLVTIEGFETFRQDRTSKSKSKKRGGGLLTYVNKKHSSHCEPILDLDTSDGDIEAQWIQIHRPYCKNVLVCNVYRPPTGNLDKAVKYLNDCIQSLNLSKINLFIMGDFNINFQNKSSESYKKLHFLIQSNGMSQYINTTTRNTDKTKSLIDLAITNSKFVSNSGTLNYFMSDHQPIYIVHKKGRDARQSVKFDGRSYRAYDKDEFSKLLSEANWGEYYCITDPGKAWTFILNNITSILDKMCPMRLFHIKNYRPAWVTNELIEQIKDRDYFYKKAKSTGDSDAWNIAKYLRNVTNTNIRKAKREFILDELETHANDCKKFWKVIRTVIPSDKQQTRQDILLKNNGSKISKDEVAGYINDYFINVGSVGVPKSTNNSNNTESGETGGDDVTDGIAHEGDDCPKLNKFGEICRVNVSRVVKDINISKSSGLNNVSSFIIKEAFLAIIPEITHMFNLSLGQSVFPAEWKKATIVPIPKSGDLTLVKNYRPISLLPLPGKILEKLVHSQLSDHIESNSLLTDVQHGFRKGHSTVHSVAQFTNYINIKSDVGLPTLATYLDFRKAFDCV